MFCNGHLFSVRHASCRACVLGVILILSGDIQGRQADITELLLSYVARAGRTAVVNERCDTYI